MNEWLTTPQHKDYIGCWGVKQKVFIVKVKYNNDILNILKHSVRVEDSDKK